MHKKENFTLGKNRIQSWRTYFLKQHRRKGWIYVILIVITPQVLYLGYTLLGLYLASALIRGSVFPFPFILGYGPIDVTINRGKRWGTYKAFLEPILQRKNLNVYRYSTAIKVILCFYFQYQYFFSIMRYDPNLIEKKASFTTTAYTGSSWYYW